MATKNRKFIQEAVERMEEKGTKGSFGKATKKKIARAKKRGGKAKKKAVFAENMKKIAEKRAGKRKAARVPKRRKKRTGARR